MIAGELMSSFPPNIFLWLGLLIIAGKCLSSLQLKQNYQTKKQPEQGASIKNKILTKSFIGFFIAGVLLQVSFVPFYNFFALYLLDLSYPGYAVGFRFFG